MMKDADNSIFIKNEDCMRDYKKELMKIKEKFNLEVINNDFITTDKVINFSMRETSYESCKKAAEGNNSIYSFKPHTNGFDNNYFLDKKYLARLKEKEIKELENLINKEVKNIFKY